jgi:hypothetical protein
MGKIEFAQALLDEHKNDWDGSSSVDDIAAAKYAVVVSRDNDSWVVACSDADEVAQVYVGALHADGDVEWVDEVYEVETGEPVQYRARTNVSVTIGDDDDTGEASV